MKIPFLLTIIIISVHILRPNEGAIHYTFKDTLEINLEPRKKYLVRVVDIKYTLMTINPKIVPGQLFHLPENSGLILVYFDVGDPSCYRSSVLT